MQILWFIYVFLQYCYGFPMYSYWFTVVPICILMVSSWSSDGFHIYDVHPSALIRKLQSWAWVKNFLIVWVGLLSQFLISHGILRRILAMHTQVVSVSQHAGWFGAPCCRSTLPDQFFRRISMDFPQISADVPWISMNFPWIFNWFAWIFHEFPWLFYGFQWTSADFL